MNTALILCLAVFGATTLAQEPKWCVSNEKLVVCQNAMRDGGLNVTCVAADACIDAVIKGDADLAYASANDLVNNVDKLKIVVHENYGLSHKDVRYYGLAVVKKDKNYQLEDVKDKKTCHTGVGKTAGWNIPVGYFLRTETMTYVENQYKSAANFFKESCVPDIKTKTEDKDVISRLCKLCNGTGDAACTNKDPYADYEGAFKCMADGAGDVAFVKQGIAEKVIKEYPKYGNTSDYRLLCNGGPKAISNYSSCYIDKRPSHAVVVANDKANMILSYRLIIKAANLTVLAGKVLDKDVTGLEDYNGETKKYLGNYYEDVKALTPNRSTSIAVSVVLQVLGIFSLFLVF